MPRQNPYAPRDGQAALFDPPTTKDTQRTDGGRHSRAMAGAITAARDREILDDVDGGIATVLMAGAWAFDSFEAQNKPYGPTKVIQQMTEALTAAHMTPDSRDTGIDDATRELVAALSEADDADPAPDDIADDAPMRCVSEEP